MLKKNKKGAIELSITTVIIIVLGMTLLVLGIVLIKNIFGGATESVDTLDEKVKSEIQSLFTDEGLEVAIKLGSDKIAKVKPGSGSFGIAIGSRTPDGSEATRNRLVYKITLGDTTGNDCVALLTRQKVQSFFKTPIERENQFDTISGSNVYSIIRMDIPKGTKACMQKVYLDVYDNNAANPSERYVGGDSFSVEILRSGLF